MDNHETYKYLRPRPNWGRLGFHLGARTVCFWNSIAGMIQSCSFVREYEQYFVGQSCNMYKLGKNLNGKIAGNVDHACVKLKGASPSPNTLKNLTDRRHTLQAMQDNAPPAHETTHVQGRRIHECIDICVYHQPLCAKGNCRGIRPRQCLNNVRARVTKSITSCVDPLVLQAKKRQEQVNERVPLIKGQWHHIYSSTCAHECWYTFPYTHRALHPIRTPYNPPSAAVLHTASCKCCIKSVREVLLEKVKTENFTFVLVSTSCSGKFNKCRWLAGAVEAQRGDYMKGAGRVIDVDLHSSARSCILLSTEEQHQLAKAYPVTPQKARSKTMQGGA
eukprot:1138964-Pelagomonas_calceolata.AAC.4